MKKEACYYGKKLDKLLKDAKKHGVYFGTNSKMPDEIIGFKSNTEESRICLHSTEEEQE